MSDYSKKTLEIHQESINIILGKIDADFRIKDLCEQQDLRRSEAISCGFDLEFFGKHKVGLEGSEIEPHFKNTLSEGDKGSLAFAFFVSVLIQNNNLKDCLIVFDDPISSFDSERKMATSQILSSISNTKGEKPEQVIVLTHESGFLIRLTKQFATALFLRIIPNGLKGTVKQSTFDRLDVYDVFMKPGVFEALERIEECVNGHSTVYKNAHEDCRVVLENAFKSKYYLDLKTDISNNKSLGSYLETLVVAGRITQLFADEFKDILSDVHEPHHSGLEAVRVANSDGDIKTILRTSLDLLKRI